MDRVLALQGVGHLTMLILTQAWRRGRIISPRVRLGRGPCVKFMMGRSGCRRRGCADGIPASADRMFLFASKVFPEQFAIIAHIQYGEPEQRKT